MVYRRRGFMPCAQSGCSLCDAQICRDADGPWIWTALTCSGAAALHASHVYQRLYVERVPWKLLEPCEKALGHTHGAT
jgi:hypothetical protein